MRKRLARVVQTARLLSCYALFDHRCSEREKVSSGIFMDIYIYLYMYVCIFLLEPIET